MGERASQTHFLNIDLEIGGCANLASLVSSFGSAMFELRQTETIAALELSTDPVSMEEAVVKLSGIVERLPPSARQMWDSCVTRTFNVGIQAGSAVHVAEFDLSAGAISQLSKTGADLRLTIYREQQAPHG